MKIMTIRGGDIPKALRSIPSPPHTLYVLGDSSILSAQPMVGIVGSRKVSMYGKAVTEQFASSLAGQGVVVVSGLAIGVDGIAHQASLHAGGRTIAVLPCGLDAIYPSSHRQLAEDILKKGGALISEYPVGTPPLKQHFIARNRLISGLSAALLVTEAAAKSGSLHTAQFALEQGRTVFAVPGNITSNLSEGTNNLLYAGASIAIKPQDICDELGISKAPQQLLLPENSEEAAILQLIAGGVCDGALLQLHSGLEPAVFNQTLTMLEIRGAIKSLGVNQWRLSG